MTETILIHVFLALFISGVLMSFGAETITAEGSLLFGASIGFSGIIGAGIALVLAQMMPTSPVQLVQLWFNRITLYHSCRNGYFSM